jgi:RNA polymerase sigma factor (sigma-70 family)
MDSDDSFLNLLGRVRLGDEHASAELVRLYESEVRRFVRYRLNSPRLRRFLDSLDVCQSVFAKFFARIGKGAYELNDPKQLQQLLLKMANNKLLDHYRKIASRRHGGAALDATGQAVEWVADEAASPAKELEGRELVDLVRGRLSADEQALLDQWMQGDDWPAIASRAGASAEAVRKRFTRAVNRAASELGWEETP